MPTIRSLIEPLRALSAEGAAVSEVVPVELDRLIWVAPLTVLASVAAVLIVRGFAVWLLNPPPSFSMLGIVAPVAFTTVLILGGVVVFVIVACVAHNPIRVYRAIAFVALLLSFVPCVSVAGQAGKVPGAGWPAAIALMFMHVVAWYVTVSMLTRLCSGRRA
jgi:Fe2+ transport system protein B